MCWGTIGAKNYTVKFIFIVTVNKKNMCECDCIKTIIAQS